MHGWRQRQLTDAFDYNHEDWSPVDEDVRTRFDAVRVSESLLHRSRRRFWHSKYLRKSIVPLHHHTFSTMCSRTAAMHYDHQQDRSWTMSRPKVQEYFRTKMGIGKGDPLLDVFRLDAIRLVRLRVLKQPNHLRDTLELPDDATPALLVEICKANREALIESLEALVKTIDASEIERKSHYYDHRDLSLRYLAFLRREVRCKKAPIYAAYETDLTRRSVE